MDRCVKIEQQPFGGEDALVLHTVNHAQQRVLVVSSCAAFRKDFARIIQRQSSFVICGEVENLRTVSAAVTKLMPQIVVLYFEKETVPGLALINFLRTKFPELRILVISDQKDEACAERALRLGANGYLPITEMEPECIHALRVVSRMDAYTTPTLTARMLKKAYQSVANSIKPLPRLTTRETKILDFLSAGLNETQIACKLHLSQRAVVALLKRLRRKLRLPTNEALRAYALGRL